MISGWNRSLSYLTTCRVTPFDNIRGKYQEIFVNILHIQHYKWFLAEIWIHRTQQHLVWHHLRELGVIINRYLQTFFTQHYKWFLAEIWVYHTQQHVVFHHLRELAVKINIYLHAFFAQHYKWFLAELWVYLAQQHVVFHQLRK